MFNVIVLSEGDLFSVGISYPLISISVIAAQFFKSISSSVFPLIVIFRYLAAERSEKAYLSADRVSPLLVPEYTFIKLDPSLEIDIANLYDLSSPLYQAISILQMIFFAPRSAWNHEPIPSCD